ncbi:MAG: acyloxyacyl hydrolase [Gammaproteobacteria bacterium]|nr:acyloxyacyl hydrolase [Gammaproteobacteria bacterium]
MKLFKRICYSVAGFFLLSNLAYATGVQFGVTLPFLIKGKDPEGVHGYRAVLWYQPPKLIWPKFEIYFAGGYGHWWAHGATVYRSLNIYAIAPVLRFYFSKNTYIDPYGEISIGASYLTKTHFSDRNLGIHYSFQDEVGIGAAFGKEKRFYFTLSALHYSNGSMASMNAGITVPLVLNVGYKFG